MGFSNAARPRPFWRLLDRAGLLSMLASRLESNVLIVRSICMIFNGCFRHFQDPAQILAFSWRVLLERSETTLCFVVVLPAFALAHARQPAVAANRVAWHGVARITV